MSALIYCSSPLTKIPYFLEGLQINIYSMEELNYYILTETYLLDHSFMSLKLCTWIDKECGMPELAEQLKELTVNRGRISEFVLAIMKAVPYCTREESRRVLSILHQMEEKSDFECGKIRADKLLEGNRILPAIYEYRRVLERIDAGDQSRILLGSVWHNLGTAYAKLFLFEEAAACFHKAYSLNGKIETLKELLYACLGMDETNHETFLGVISEYHIDQASADAIRQNWEKASASKEAMDFSEAMNELLDSRSDGRAAFDTQTTEIIEQWEDEYRKVCHI